jgi:hypothetical protein
MSKIFLSYRRDDSADVMGRIYDYLTPPLGPFESENVFKDVDSIPFGVNFKHYLEQQVTQCKVLLAVIGPQWISIVDEDGQRRLDNPRDFVRIEIETALQRGIPVVPLLVMGAKMPEESELPETLRDLVYQNGMSVRRDPDFKGDMGRLTKSIQTWLKRTQSLASLPVDAVIKTPVTSAQIEKWLKLMGDRRILPKTRIRAARQLAEVGDPRPGVGVSSAGLPEFEWCAIPAGVFPAGSDLDANNGNPPHTGLLEIPVKLSKYPVTVAQYQAFLDAPDGYTSAEWWTELVKPESLPPLNWTNPTDPRTDLSWYECVAFCRWCSAKLGILIRLPTEYEWEKAARGTDERVFPWGDDYFLGTAHFTESDYSLILDSHDEPTPVGVYPQTQSPYGCLDMCWNVTEWTATADERIMIVRGGGIEDKPGAARTTRRLKVTPTTRLSSLGLRVAHE